MTLEFDPESKLTFNRFGKLGMWYILALSAIAIVSIVGQFLIQNHLRNQLSDSHVINVAGRQRMLSQRITKCALLIQPDQTVNERTEIVEELRTALKLWTINHSGLQLGNDSLHLPGQNSADVNAMFAAINAHHEAMKSSASSLVKQLTDAPQTDFSTLKPSITTILLHQHQFLDGMNQIVFQYDTEAKQKIDKLSKLEYVLLFISIAVILLEIIFVFRPTTVEVNQTVNQLMASEKNAKKLSKEIGALYSSLERSYEEISQVNIPTETPRLYAKTDRGGNVIFISDLFTELSGKKIANDRIALVDIFQGAHLPEDWMEDVLESVAEGSTWQAIIRYASARGKEHWADVMIVPAINDNSEVEEWLVLGSDITRQKQAEQNMRAKSRAEIEKKINQQKFRSVLILEGQEEERKRLAMDIHDGIGQMLTSLKFQIESIDLEKNGDSVKNKL